ncbi:DNA-binding transcriptional regulator, PadR family [Paramicrobacterium humi]|uniref:DNA-binding transcriptional regulator, PadR family n=1 Tax=Paramicrobacterium humi TaxID=640635 RepID=A0A1H4K0H8_9MICO|nr:PadR family transcriptional regulator [Microbacterium humi]SEB51382.1 DNA-binding transcriptional regulator, PadR family [Microbacterium humi]
MSVKQSLLAILDQGPAYGYQLKAEFDRRTGSTWPLNVGQTYSTLERLERDGLVIKSETDAEGHQYYEITEAGHAEVAGWLSSPVERNPSTRDELAVKLALAATLPGVDITQVVQVQRRASLANLQSLTRTKYNGGDADGPEELAWQLVVDNLIFQAEAEVRWLDHVETRLKRHANRVMPVAAERPRRGRPVSTPAEGAAR